jgi:predicted Zn-dependent protease with MMP-like domain
MTQEAFDTLPEQFQRNMENVRIVIEERPDSETLARMNIESHTELLGLYEGVPLNKRGTWYGMSPVVPDKITLYKENIERSVRTTRELREQISHVLIHEIAHYYGMNEEDVRAAGY